MEISEHWHSPECFCLAALTTAVLQSQSLVWDQQLALLSAWIM